MSMPTVQGRCPACGDEGSLFLGDGGYVTCSNRPCPMPDAAHLILEEADPRHIVRIDADGGGFNMQHPLVERVNMSLLDCTFNERVADAEWHPRPGTTWQVGLRDPGDAESPLDWSEV